MVKIHRNINLAEYTTFHIGGNADFFARIKSLEELRDAVAYARNNKLPIMILGEGSNVLLPDGKIRKLILKIDVRGITFKNNRVYAGAGEMWDKVVKSAVSKNLGGTENLSLIPGTVGGAVYQNIGAYGTELKDILGFVDVFDIDSGRIKKISAKDCKFGYRDSVFQHHAGEKYIILRAELKLNKNPIPNIIYPDLAKYFEGKNKKEIKIKNIRLALLKIRKSKLVYPTQEIGTAGSFFKNPEISTRKFNELLKKYPDLKGKITLSGNTKLSAGQLIEKSGWKGKRLGNVGVSSKHALVIVSYGKARAEEVLALARSVQDSVKNQFSVALEPEVKILTD